LLVPAGFFLYYTYIYVSTEGRLNYFSVQKAIGWYLTGTNPLALLYESLVRPRWMTHFFGALFSSLGLLALVACFRRLRFSHFVAGVLLILVPLCSGQAKLLSMQRFLIVVFPLMIVCALGTRKHSSDANADRDAGPDPGVPDVPVGCFLVQEDSGVGTDQRTL